MKNIALAASAVMLASASVVGLEHDNIPMPRRRPRVKPAPVMREPDYTWLEQHALQREETDRKIAEAKAKRARKGEKLKAVAAAGGIKTLVSPAAATVDPSEAPAEKPKRPRAKKTTTF